MVRLWTFHLAVWYSISSFGFDIFKLAAFEISKVSTFVNPFMQIRKRVNSLRVFTHVEHQIRARVNYAINHVTVRACGTSTMHSSENGERMPKMGRVMNGHTRQRVNSEPRGRCGFSPQPKERTKKKKKKKKKSNKIYLRARSVMRGCLKHSTGVQGLHGQ